MRKRIKVLLFAVMAVCCLSACTEHTDELENANSDANLNMPAMKSHIVDSTFDFTPSEFYEVFGNTLPDGYELNTELVHNVLFNNMLQISILYSDSKSENRNTGINVAFGYVEETDTISQIMLWSSTETPTDVFETLLSWYLKVILPEMSTETYETAVEKFLTDFKEDRDAFSAIMGDNYVIAIKRVSGFDEALVYHYVSIALK